MLTLFLLIILQFLCFADLRELVVDRNGGDYNETLVVGSGDSQWPVGIMYYLLLIRGLRSVGADYDERALLSVVDMCLD